MRKEKKSETTRQPASRYGYLCHRQTPACLAATPIGRFTVITINAILKPRPQDTGSVIGMWPRRTHMLDTHSCHTIPSPGSLKDMHRGFTRGPRKIQEHPQSFDGSCSLRPHRSRQRPTTGEPDKLFILLPVIYLYRLPGITHAAKPIWE